MEGSQPGPTAPFLRWAGSKRQQTSQLARFWHPSFRRYVEPFLGSGVLFFHIAPLKALIGDINADLVATFLHVKQDPLTLSRYLRRLRKGPESYYRLRAQDPMRLTATQRAARFIYLNRYCFNGIYRTNSKGGFNVPYGGDKTGNLPSPQLILACSRSLANTTIVAADFEVLLDRTQHGDFVYLDPPYSVRKRRLFAEYNPSGFTPHDLRRLRASLLRLDRMGVSFLLTYAVSEEAEELRRGFNAHIVTTRRNVAGFASHRRLAREMLISNIDPL